MILKRRGFSLAELLLAVGIIGIITAMGMAITKHTADKAYNGYWYNGYITLYNIIGDFNNKQYFTDNTNSHFINSNVKFASELNTILNGTLDNDDNTKTTAKNKISYKIDSRETVTIGDNSDILYRITMTVPQQRTRQNQNGTASATLFYIQNEGILIPSADNNIDLQNRKDLLPAFYDTGIRNNNRIKTESSRVYLSYNRAYCNNHTLSYIVIKNDNTQDTLINCNPVGGNNISGILRVVNPAKVR